MPDQRVEPIAPSSAARDPAARRPLAIVRQVEAERLVLVEYISRDRQVETWTAQLEPRNGDALDGKTMVATRVPVGAGPARERLRRRLAALAAVDDPRLLPPLALVPLDEVTWVLSEGQDGVSLRRLAARATLSPPQVVVVGFAILAGLAALHDAGIQHGAVKTDNVWVERSGAVRLGGATEVPDSTRRSMAARRRDLEMASQLLVGILPRARATTYGRQREQVSTTALRNLLEGTGLAGLGDARTAMAAFELAAGDLGTSAACAGAVVGLGTLVPLVRRHRDASTSGPVAPATQPGVAVAAPQPMEPGDVSTPAGRQGAATTVELVGHGVDRQKATPAPWVTPPLTVQRPPRRLLTLAVIGITVAALIAAVLLGIRIAHRGRATTPNPNHATTLPSARSATALPTAPPPAKPSAAVALAPPAPPQAGDVSSISVAPAAGSSCTAVAGGSCTVVAHVNLGPHATEQVAWHFVLVDMCTGASATEPGGGVLGLSSYEFVYDTSAVSFPTHHPTRIYAVTSAPAVAASAPLAAAGAATC
jgi:hypothetical protein